MSNKKVLVTDDDPVVRVLVTEFLTCNGYEVETLDSGSACLDRLEHELPDILVLDLLMPDMTGIEVLQKIRANPMTSNIPIVMLSADLETEALINNNNVTADSYVQKPFGVKDILTAVRSISRT
jgi:two-component system, OmpR family, response regulator VicR